MNTQASQINSVLSTEEELRKCCQQEIKTIFNPLCDKEPSQLVYIDNKGGNGLFRLYKKLNNQILQFKSQIDKDFTTLDPNTIKVIYNQACNQALMQLLNRLKGYISYNLLLSDGSTLPLSESNPNNLSIEEEPEKFLLLFRRYAYFTAYCLIKELILTTTTATQEPIQTWREFLHSQKKDITEAEIEELKNYQAWLASTFQQYKKVAPLNGAFTLIEPLASITDQTSEADTRKATTPPHRHGRSRRLTSILPSIAEVLAQGKRPSLQKRATR